MKPYKQPTCITWLALAAITCELAVRAAIVPVAQDTSSSAKGLLTSSAGKASSLAVTPTEHAFLYFDLTTLPASLTASNVTQARLLLYVTKATTPGSLTLHLVTGRWSETAASTEAPAFLPAAVATIPETDVVAKDFIEVDVTAAVTQWLSGETNFGLAVATTSGTVALASKEGLGTGFPALLEIDSSPAALSGANILAGSIGSTQLGVGAVTVPSIASNIGVWSMAGSSIFYDDGEVGIGTNNPSSPLYVQGVGNNASGAIVGVQTSGSVNGSGVYGLSLLPNGAGVTGEADLAASGGAFPAGVAAYSSATNGVGLYAVTSSSTGLSYAVLAIDESAQGYAGYFQGRGYFSSNVGIGTTTPVAGLEVEVSGSVSAGTWSYFQKGAINTNIFGGSPALAIYTAGNIGASTYYAFSDARIKNIVGVSSTTQDLNMLRAIQVTDYSYKDTVANGNRQVKKVIAQQVESVYPQAVSQTRGVIPDIYQQATLQGGWVKLATNLKVGERVKLISEDGQGIYQVLETRAGAFRTDFKAATEKVFVYGREVNDFRNVDYEALTTLNVSATQELARKLEAQEAALTKLQAKFNEALADKDALLKHLAALEARDQAREDRLARIEGNLDKSSVRASFAALNHQ